MINKYLIEVCCGSVNDCITASKENIDRIELNHALELGGLTPSVGSLVESLKHVTVPILCMVRPRGFGFNYTEEEFQSMLYDAKNLIDNGASGIVFGFLHPDGTIDTKRTKEMVEVIKPHTAVFHKAFDATPNLDASLVQLIECGIDRVLTSGGSVYPDIEKGCLLMHEMITKYGDKIEILPGGGVRSNNVQAILKTTKSNQIHMSASHKVLDSSTIHYNTNSHLEADHSFTATSTTSLKAIISKIKELDN